MSKIVMGLKAGASVAAAALFFSLMGCAAKDKAPEPSPDPAAESVDAATETSDSGLGASEAETDADADAGTPEATAEPATDYSDPKQCVLGEWQGDMGLFAAQMNQMAEGKLISTTGEFTTNFMSDGKTQSKYDDWELTFLADGVEVVITRVGIDEGEYKINSDNTIDIHDTVVNSQINLSSSAMSMNIPAEKEGFSAVKFICSENEMIINAPGGDTKLTR